MSVVVAWLTNSIVKIDIGQALFLLVSRSGIPSLCSWRDFARECFCFGCEDVNGSGEAVGGLVKSRVEFPPAQIRRVFAPAGFWPRGQNPRRHYSLPRYTYKECVNIGVVCL